MTLPDISAVLVTWNSGSSAARAVAALRASASATGAKLQVVVVDNASSDGCTETIPLLEGDVLVRNPLNAGYGVAAAQGASRATGRWILFLNPDVVVDRRFVGSVLAAAESAPGDVATLVPDLRFVADPGVINSRGVSVDDIGVPAEIDAGFRAGDAADNPDVFGGSTGCCLVRADALRLVGGIEACYFAYLDDVDLAQRLQQAGFAAAFVPGALAYHEGSASLGEGSALKAYLVARNRRLLFRIHGPWGVRARLWRALIEAGHAAVSVLGGGGIAPLQGRLDAIRLRGYTRFARASRVALEHRARPRYAPRRGFLETLRRKRAARTKLVRR